MRIIKVHYVCNAPFFIMLFILLTLWGCGNGGSGSSRSSESGDNAISANSNSESVESGSIEPGPGSSKENSVTLTWDKPDSNSDGSDINDLAGYKVYFGISSNNYTQSIDVGNITSAEISNLSSGTWCFATTAYDTAGNESGYSNEACKTI